MFQYTENWKDQIMKQANMALTAVASDAYWEFNGRTTSSM